MADQILTEIKDKLDIAEVISSYIPIKKSGINFKAVCPFHNEKTASLMISPPKQIWHCFGCGEGGDVFGFVMRYENLEFRDALKILADKAGVILPQYSGQSAASKDISEQLIRINSFAAEFYSRLLWSKQGEVALNYLRDRGLSDDTIKQWQIGYAPNDFHALEKALLTKNVKLTMLVDAGVSVKNEAGQIYDRFRDRVTFPITNYQGEVVGFSARNLKDSNEAKYINSPETEIYNKSKVLFGLSKAKDAIRKQQEVIVVEGQMDTISAHQAGFSNVVASSGTALTETQLVVLGRLTKNTKFCFDKDTAGSTATLRASALALSLGFKVKIIQLPEGKDPDELIRSHKDLWNKAVNEAPWLIDFYIDEADKRFGEASVEQTQYVSQFIIPFVKYFSDPLEQDFYVKKIADHFAMKEQTIRQILQTIQLEVSPQEKAVSVTMPLQINPLEKEVLGGLLQYPALSEPFKNELKLDDFTSNQIRQIVSSLLSGSKLPLDNDTETIAKEAQFMVESELDSFEGNELALSKQLEKSFYMLKLAGVRRLQEQISRQIKRAEINSQAEELEKLNNEFAELIKQRLLYENKLV